MAGNAKIIPWPSPISGRKTRILLVDPSRLGKFTFASANESFLEDWDLELSDTVDAAHINTVAVSLRSDNVPVAFPTETVYGLGADATRSAAVLGIYAAKQRPADNPLIVHVSSLSQLRELLRNPVAEAPPTAELPTDPIPFIYHSLISRFWPGPLTILLPVPTPNPFAPQVSASLPTFGVRMPSSPLALALIHLAGIPLAAPSANTSTKPSPTTAAHVLEDLSGRIDLILDGGSCEIGVESTVVDGLVDPPLILRPGGISIEMLRDCPGWEGVQAGYKDRAEAEKPRAPGMKYRHYSPRARVILVDGKLDTGKIRTIAPESSCIGILRTKTWSRGLTEGVNPMGEGKSNENVRDGTPVRFAERRLQEGIADEKLALPASASLPAQCNYQLRSDESSDDQSTDVWDIGLGEDPAGIARGLFSALRQLDQKGVEVIFVEGINDSKGDTAAAVMNRLRKAAEREIKV